MSTIKFEDVKVLSSEIVFKQINVEDFTPFGYEVTKAIITPSDEGYISNQVNFELNLAERNTVVLNAGVGQGKTHTILDIAKRYYDDGYCIVFAVPYKSLIDQYFADLTNEERNIIPNDIVDYRLVEDEENINEEDIQRNAISPKDASRCAIHLLTVNAILGNPGEDAIKQAQKKIEYINLIIERCKKENRKVVLIFDEIHDSIHNFQEKLIFNLWKWKNIIQKIFCVSATYNEASKIVIKYLAEITESKIQILESERIKFEFKQSDLFLLLYNKQHYNTNDSDLVDFFNYLISKNKKINVLSFSKTIAEKIADKQSPIGKILWKKFKDINLCTGDTEVPFDPSKCNVGTTFSTGINIRGNDSAFVVLLPSLLSYQQRKLGVFSRGINILIQALARIRDKSEIYIITPSPNYLINYQNQNKENYTKNVKLVGNFKDIPTKDKYFDINSQREYINEIYESIKDNIRDEIEYIKTRNEQNLRQGKPSLEFPLLDNYILSDGEKALVLKYDIFGKNLSTYTFWAAFNDQFINCRLKGITILNELIFKEGEIMKGLNEFALTKLYDFIPQYLDYSSNLFNLSSDKTCYTEFKEAIFKNKVYYLKNTGEKVVIQKNKNQIEKFIIAYVQVKKKQNDYYNNLYYSNYQRWGSLEQMQVMVLKDEEYKSRDYLFACFKNSEREDYENITQEELELKDAYLQVYNFFRVFKQKFIVIEEGNREYFDEVNINSKFSATETQTLKEAVAVIKNFDPIIKTKIIGIFQKIDSDTDENFTKSLYQFFKTNFFKTETLRMTQNTVRFYRYYITEEYKMPEGKLINLLFHPKDAWWEDIVSFDIGNNFKE